MEHSQPLPKCRGTSSPATLYLFQAASRSVLSAERPTCSCLRRRVEEILHRVAYPERTLSEPLAPSKISNLGVRLRALYPSTSLPSCRLHLHLCSEDRSTRSIGD